MRASNDEAPIRLTLSSVEARHDRFHEIGTRLREALPSSLIEHIGSTAVADMPAKDVVDVLIGVERIDPALATIAALGFDIEGHRPGHAWASHPHRRDRRTVVHVVRYGSAAWRDRIEFRDLLRRDRTARAEYLDVKRRLAETTSGWGSYTAAKADTVTRLLATRRQWQTAPEPAAHEYLRFRAVEPNRHGRFPGVFALVNGLGNDGRLSAEDRAWWRRHNGLADVGYPNPSSVTADAYDPVANAGAASWFRASATHLIAFTRDYLPLLDRYGVRWTEQRTDDPGRIVHRDMVQVVAVAHDGGSGPAHNEDDPSATKGRP